MARLIICPLAQIESIGLKYQPAAMLTILSAPETVPRPASLAAGGYLQLNFHDISMMLPRMRPAQAAQIEQLLAFGRQWHSGAWEDETAAAQTEKREPRPLLIHCQMGISRSTAAAYSLACALRPDMSERAWAEILREKAPEATPNPHIIALADKALRRETRMISAIAAIGRGREACEGAPFTLEV